MLDAAKHHSSRHLLSVVESCRRLGIGRTTFYQLVKQRHLRLVKIGRRSLLPSDVLDAYLAGLEK